MPSSCVGCGRPDLPKSEFSAAQWKKKAPERRCKNCVSSGSSASGASGANIGANFGANIGAQAQAQAQAQAAPKTVANANAQVDHKALGNAAFASGDYASAERHFSDGIAAHAENVHVLFSNRSAARANLKDFVGAKADGEMCVQLAPDFVRGYSRLGLALFHLKEYAEAQKVYARGLAKDPQNSALLEGQKAVQEARKLEVEAAVAKAKRERGQQQQQTSGAADGDNNEVVGSDSAAGVEGFHDYVVGIDLGTTMSCVAVWRNGAAEVLPDESGMRTTPSWVAFDEERGTPIVGHAAKRQAAQNPSRTLFNIKRLIGKDFKSCSEDIRRMPFEVCEASNKRSLIKVPVNNRVKPMEFAPEQVSAQVLAHMKRVAEKALGEPVKRAVVTVPAYFNDSQRRLTKDAGAIAGLDVLRIINEPTAASLAYGLDKAQDAPQQILVFDLGGGTFDVSLLQINEGMFEVLATAGDTHLGGEDFDSVLFDWVADQFRLENKGKPDPFAVGQENDAARRKLRNACEVAKRELSSASTAMIELSAGGQEVSIKVTRSKFEQLNERTFQRCLEAVKRVLGDAKVKKEAVDEIVLVGGSTRVPRVQAILSEYFGGKTLCRSVNPDEAVAFGAAVQGAILSGVRDPLTQALLLVDVTPLSLGVGCEGHKFARVVPRNTQIPCKMSSEFTTVHDNQTTIDIDVMEGESPNTRDNHLLGSFEITGVQRAKQGVPKIDVTFDVNSNGLLTVSAMDKVTGAKANVEIQHDRGRLTQEEIARMCAEAEALQQQMEETETDYAL